MITFLNTALGYNDLAERRNKSPNKTSVIPRPCTSAADTTTAVDSAVLATSRVMKTTSPNITTYTHPRAARTPIHNPCPPVYPLNLPKLEKSADRRGLAGFFSFDATLSEQGERGRASVSTDHGANDAKRPRKH